MLSRAARYVRILVRREHWWAEVYSGVALFTFGLSSLLVSPTDLHNTAITHSFMLTMPNGLWQVLLMVCGSFQICALTASPTKPLRIMRGTAAALAAFFSVWVAISQVIYAWGWNPVVTFVLAWAGVNLFAMGRTIGGLR